MAALFWRNRLRLTDEEWEVYPSWEKGFDAFSRLVVRTIAENMGVSIPHVRHKYLPSLEKLVRHPAKTL